MENLNPKEEEMIDALRRSGYLLESVISKFLSTQNFFVETNQVIIDPFTGKSREIDIIAELNHFGRERNLKSKCAAKARFVFEIKNNTSPIVLLTEYEGSPNIEEWLGIKEIMTFPPELNEHYFLGFYEKIINSKENKIFSQYCSFQRKKQNQELMALHPDNIHSGLNKITQFCEEFVESWGREKTDSNAHFFRNFASLPVLLVSDNLYELSYSENGEENLEKVDSSILVNNYHYKGEANMAFIFVLTKKGLPSFIDKIIEIEEELENDMLKIREKTVT